MKAEQLELVATWAGLLGVSEPKLLELAHKMPDSQRYRVYMIRKAGGGLRMISEPIEELKEIQRKLLNLLMSKYEPLDCSHGFVPGRNIVSNAEPHARKNWVFNIDLEKFFPSIPIKRVEEILSATVMNFVLEVDGKPGKRESQEVKLSPEIARLLANLCSFRSVEGCDDPETLNGLPQGAPTSPIISDMVAHGMDLEIMAFCEKKGMTYTRYADDMSFSPQDPKDYSGYKQLLAGGGQGEPRPCKGLLSIIKRNGFCINEKKTKFFSGNSCKVVTGLTVNEFANVPRKVIRSIRADLYLWEKYAYQRANELLHKRKSYRHKKCPKALREVISGKLWYLSMVRGKGDPIYMRFVRRIEFLLGQEEKEEQEQFTPTWRPDVDMWDVNDDWRPKGKRTWGFPVELDDFPRRSPKHFSDRRRIFLEKEGDLRGMLRTEVGSWAYERLQHIFELRENLREEFTFDRFPNDEKRLIQYLVEAEAAYLHLLHDEMVVGQFHDAFSRLFFRVMRINGQLCSEKILDSAFRRHLDAIDWGKFFRCANDEFLSQRYGFEKLNSGDLLRLAASPEARAKPCASLKLWTCLSPLSTYAQDEELRSYGRSVGKVIEHAPNFFPLFDEILTSCERTRNGNPPSMGAGILRKGIYLVLKAVGQKPISTNTSRTY